MAAERLLTADHLYVARGSNPVLRDVSLHVDAGETVALVGGNGSGKSTLISALIGALPHQEGSVELFGEPLASFTQWRRIGYVPQHSQISLLNATVEEIVSSGRIPHRRPFLRMRATDRAAIRHAISTVGLAERAHWPFASLSGGQKQRTLIARALATEPDLFLMDEPMAGVDIHSQAGIGALLDSLVQGGRGLLVVLHETGAVAIDRTVTLCEGRVTTVVHADSQPTHDQADQGPLGLDSFPST
ncbi:metal ABC transporter ATP-binding protein [Tessaracoccus sp. OH4464_COT-324]|uniref:metal ABC transporter ATP-binding protein n=1 Tax=Tessaracoccus sp. OH4464_COT-324 TaxID=2491059 RepID=UPI000F63ED26|nr:ATP-binding cassette domain-containing protein [Tessaracoccus sp. OH4464_COT-324]RRD47834.1 ATP-binding cassette domain-containing protein [Tessaracoccus sp. OH4464_COT-324]